MSRLIQLTNGPATIVDDDWYEMLSIAPWHELRGKRGTTYARTISHYYNGVRGGELMHRVIMDAPKNITVDHINGDGLDNRRANLRLCSQQENTLNRKKSKNKSSIYKGVSYCKEKGLWQAYIRKDGRHGHLGFFDKEEDAAMAYNKSAADEYGKFARLNVFPLTAYLTAQQVQGE